MSSPLQNYLCEFLGTLFFLFVILATGNPLAIGLTLTLVILLLRNISGGHVNPAVTIAMASLGNLPTSDVLPYIMAQGLGGLVAVEIYRRVKK